MELSQKLSFKIAENVSELKKKNLRSFSFLILNGAVGNVLM